MRFGASTFFFFYLCRLMTNIVFELVERCDPLMRKILQYSFSVDMTFCKLTLLEKKKKWIERRKAKIKLSIFSSYLRGILKLHFSQHLFTSDLWSDGKFCIDYVIETRKMKLCYQNRGFWFDKILCERFQGIVCGLCLVFGLRNYRQWSHQIVGFIRTQKKGCTWKRKEKPLRLFIKAFFVKMWPNSKDIPWLKNKVFQ